MVRKIVFGILVALLGLSLLGSGYLIGYLHRASSDEISASYPLLDEARALVVEHYFGEIPDEIVLQRGMIHGMVSKIGDRFTIYVEPAANELQADDLMGRFGGIGAHLTKDDEGFFHVVPYPDGPAYKAGILEDYRLVTVDEVQISSDTNFDEVISLIRGDVGTSVSLQFLTDEFESYQDFNVERVEFDIPSVTSYSLPSNQDIGVIIIHRFSDRTRDEVEEAYDQLTATGIHGLLLDLRGNAGGILDAAIDVAKIFLDNGLILVQTEADGEVKEFEVNQSGKGSQIPLVVLINTGTASASEVLAAALSENDRAPLVGEQSYGKGSVQSVLSLSDDSSLHVTVARWLTPNRTSIDGSGISPDFVVQSDDGERDTILDQGISVLMEIIGDQE
jgi:carboxyl-terminal processing protease